MSGLSIINREEPYGIVSLSGVFHGVEVSIEQRLIGATEKLL